MSTKQKLVSLYTIIAKEFIRICRIWPQTLLPPVITTSLYLIIFGQVIGARLGTFEESLSYMQFIIPGLVMMSIITNSYSNTSSSFFIAKFQKNIEELLISPTPSYIIILGYIAGGMLRGLLSGLMVYTVSYFFHFSEVKHPTLLIVIAMLASFIFSLIGLINALYARKFDDVNWVPTFVLTPLTYLGGVFFTVNLLTPSWQKVALLNPILYIISTFRYAFIEVSYVDLTLSLTVMVSISILLFILALNLGNKGFGVRN